MIIIWQCPIFEEPHVQTCKHGHCLFQMLHAFSMVSTLTASKGKFGIYRVLKTKLYTLF